MKSHYLLMSVVSVALTFVAGANVSAAVITNTALTNGVVRSTAGGSIFTAAINGENAQVGTLSGGDSNYKAVFEFNLPILDDVTISLATINLYVSTSNATQDIYLRQISADGSVTTADYNSTPLNQGGVFLSAGTFSGGYITFDIAGMIQTAIDNHQSYFAIRLETQNPAYGSVNARANVKGINANVPANQLPYISFTYTAIPEPNVTVMFGLGAFVCLFVLRRRKQATA